MFFRKKGPTRCDDPRGRVTAVSDGLFEWADDADEAFGLERLHAVIRSHRRESAEGLLAAIEQSVRAFAGKRPQQDDVTGLVIKRLAD